MSKQDVWRKWLTCRPLFGSVRIRLAALVVLITFLGVTVGLAIDYRSEYRLHTEITASSLELYAQALALSFDYAESEEELQSQVNTICGLMSSRTADEHRLIILNPGGGRLTCGHQREDDELARALGNVSQRTGCIDVGEHQVAYALLAASDGRRIVIGQSLDYVREIVAAQLCSRLVTALIICVILVGALLLLLDRGYLKPIGDLSHAAVAWSGRDFAFRCQERGDTVLERLIRMLNAMAGRLQGEEVRRAVQLTRARDIQAHLMPTTLPSVPGLDVATAYRPAEHVSGDLYDVVPLPNSRTAIAIVDVAGHGLSAALLTGVVKMSLHRWLAEEAVLPRVVANVNRDLLGCSEESSFVTACIGIWNHQDQTWTYAAAGHPAGMLLSDGRATALAVNGALLGVLPQATWPASTVTLRTGDRLFLYSDGVVDPGAGSGRLQEDELQNILCRSSGISLNEQVQLVTEAAMDRCAAVACDDVTMVGIEVLPPAKDYVI